MTWKVFPVDGKRPALGGNWRSHATDDPTTIKGWLDAGYGLGLPCDLNGLIVIDPDADKTTRDPIGDRELAELGDLPETYTVPTPGGGRHLYFDDGGQPVAGRDLAAHVNVRSRGGYVVIYDDYYITGLSGSGYWLPDIAPCPDWIRVLVAHRASTKAKAPEAPNLATGMHRARTMLDGLAGAVEGAGGDNWTYQVIQKVIDVVPSDDPATLLDTMGPWNDRCSPPWDDDELLIKIENALQYRQNDVGAWAVADPMTRFPDCNGSVGVGQRVDSTPAEKRREIPVARSRTADVPDRALLACRVADLRSLSDDVLRIAGKLEDLLRHTPGSHNR